MHTHSEWGTDVPELFPLSPGKSQLVPRAPQDLVLPPLHLPNVLWWTPRGLDYLRGPTTS